MASARRAGPGMAPASPTPLIPRGLRGDRRLQVRDLHGRDLHRRRQQEIHVARRQRLPVTVAGELLVKSAADSLGHSAADLPLHDGRIDHRAAVVLDHVAEHVDVARLDVDLDDGGVAAAGKRRLRRRVVTGRFEPGRLAGCQHGASPRLDQAQGGLRGLLAVGVANGIGRRREGAESERPARGAAAHGPRRPRSPDRPARPPGDRRPGAGPSREFRGPRRGWRGRWSPGRGWRRCRRPS